MSRVIYSLAKGRDEVQTGRLYPEAGMGLANMSFDIRNPLIANYYWDFDIENAHYTFLPYWGKKWGIRTEAIEEYVANRDVCLLLVSEDRVIAKVSFLRVAYGSIAVVNEVCGTNHEDVDIDHFEEEHIIKRIQKEITLMMDACWKHNPEMRRFAKNKKNPKASLFAEFLQTEERKCLMAMDDAWTKLGRYMGIYIHDGGCVEKLDGETEAPVHLIPDVEKHVLEATGYKVRITNKPIKHSYVIPEANTILSGGVKEQDFFTMRKAFEKNHFYLMENQTICEEKDGRIVMYKPESALTAFADSWGFDIEETGKAVSRVSFVKLWLSRPGRRTYDRLAFNPDPSKVKDTEYNMFKGLAAQNLTCEPNQEGLARFIEILKNLTSKQ